MSYSVDLRKKVIEYVQKGGRVVNASRLFGVGRRTIHQWLLQLATTGHLEKKTYARTQFKIDRDTLKTNIDNHPDAYLKEHAETFNVSVSGIWRALQAMKITRKKKSKLTKKEMK